MIVEDGREAGDSSFNAGLKVRGVAEGKKKLNDLDNEDSGCCKQLWLQLFAFTSGIFMHVGSAFKQ